MPDRMLAIESPQQLAGHVLPAHKALLLLGAHDCPDSQVVKERFERVKNCNSSLVVATADVTKVPGLAKALGIGVTPAVVLFRRGKRVSTVTGRVTGAQLQKMVDSVHW